MTSYTQTDYETMDIYTYITEIDGAWYAYSADETSNNVYSVGADNPPRESGGTAWTARWTEGGIKYVASASPNKQAAAAKARRHGKFSGIIEIF